MKNALLFLSIALAALTFACQPGDDVSTDDTEKKLKVGFIYIGPAGDYGWTYAHDQARAALEEKYDWLEAITVESVPQSMEAVSYIERLIQEEGVEVVFTTSFDYMDPTIEIAKDYPEVAFFHCSGYKTADNVGIYFGDLYQMYYLNGMMAAALSASGQLGYVAAFPIAELFRHINAFALGAQVVNPEATVDLRWILTWYGPTEAKEAAEALISTGVDVLAFTEDTPAVIEVAESYTDDGQNVYSFSHYSPMLDYGPDSVISGQLMDWTGIYEKLLLEVYNDNWTSKDVWWLAEEGAAILGADFDNLINPVFVDQLKATPVSVDDLEVDNVYDLIMARLEQMTEGREVFDPYAGPIVDKDGVVRVAEGSMASQADLVTMDYLVQGVVGALPE